MHREHNRRLDMEQRFPRITCVSSHHLPFLSVPLQYHAVEREHFGPFLALTAGRKPLLQRLGFSILTTPSLKNSEFQYHVTISQRDTSVGASNLVFHGKRSPMGSLFLQSAADDPSPCVDLRLHAW
jgi:hypothetical protein